MVQKYGMNLDLVTLEDYQALETHVARLADLVRRAQPAIKLFGGAPAPDWLADATEALAALESDAPTSKRKGS